MDTARSPRRVSRAPGHDIQCGLHSGIPPCCIAWYVTVWVEWPQERRDPERYQGARGAPPWAQATGDLHLYAEIDATDAQQQLLAPIVKGAAQDFLPLRAKMHEAHRRAVELLSQDALDRAALETLRADHMRLAEQASRRFIQALADVADVLTPEQRRQLAQHIGRWHGSHGVDYGGLAPHLLLIEDDRRLAEMVADYLGEAGFRVSTLPMAGPAWSGSGGSPSTPWCSI